jgi:orotidine-5'-phosphate decarboxylase
MKDRLCLALDIEDEKEILRIVEELKDEVGYFKLNSAFTKNGPELIKKIKTKKAKLFLDLKFHDIPNTVGNYASIVTAMGIDIFNVHASGGFEMMKSAVMSAEETSKKLKIPKPKVIAVTILTSLNQDALKNELNITENLEDQVVHLALLAKKAGCDGVVASAKEASLIRKACGTDFLIITPGIRPSWSEKGDQKRVLEPKDAIKAGSSLLVIGRPILDAEDRKAAAKKIIDEIDKGNF